jgi:hypothetical protein
MNHASTPCDDGDIVRLAKEPNLATVMTSWPTGSLRHGGVTPVGPYHHTKLSSVAGRMTPACRRR